MSTYADTDYPWGFLGYQNPDNAFSPGLANALTVKSGEGRLFGFSVLNTKASAQFIQLFDATTLPADTAVPVWVMTVAASSNGSAYWGTAGRWFMSGIIVCNSSTSSTKTIGSADCFFDAQYL